jgi:Ti-type conjugative transfer relaxase TraA
MAIYHFSSSVISRSQGRSAVACSAYRSAELMHDEKYGKTHDYTRKQDVIFNEVLLPANAKTWMKDREKLWNGVEFGEKRKDAQLAREIQFSLPRELSNEQNTLLAREFIQANFVDKGMVADWASHVDKTPSGELQPHVHVMLTMRELIDEGFGQKVREWNRKEVLFEWREAWAENANRHLAMHGHDIQIDHRSNAERGISLEAQYKIGTSVASHRMAKMEDHQRIARENGEKLFLNPTLALESLTKQQSTFTHQDLAKFIHRHSGNAEQFQHVYDKVKGSHDIVFLGIDDNGRERYTTQEMLKLETKMMAQAQQLSAREFFEVSEKSQALALSSKNLSEQQQTAFEHLTEKGDIKCVVGYAGSGKSYLLGAAREAWEKEGYRVMGATLSGIAAENLEESSGIESRTLASRMYYWDNGEQLLTSKDVLVIDEAGMIGSRQMAKVLDEVQKHNAKVVLIGDPEQLQAIDAGASFRAISEQTGFVELTEVRRQREGWQREATKEFAKGLTQEALIRYRQHDHVHEFETQAVAKKAIIEQWNDVRVSDPDKTQIILAYTRKDVQELNEMARETRRELGELGQDHVLQTAKGEKPFADHDRIYFTQNDKSLDVRNGTLGTIVAIEDKKVTVCLDREEGNDLQKDRGKGLHTVTVDLDKYNHIDHGYAATIHKSQGVTVDMVYLLASRHMDRHAAYVGMSRHRASCDLFYSKEEFQYEIDLSRTLGRDRGKDISLDYSIADEAFSGSRGSTKTTEKHKGHEINKLFADHRRIHVSEDMLKEYEKLPKAIGFEKNGEPSKQGQSKEVSSDLMREFGFSAEEVSQFSRGNLYVNSLQERDELMEFKKVYERENPHLAKSLSDEMRTTTEKRAQQIEKAFDRLHYTLEEDPRNKEVKQELNKLVSGASKDTQVMQHLKERSPELKRQIESLNQQYEKERSRTLERSYSLSR